MAIKVYTFKLYTDAPISNIYHVYADGTQLTDSQLSTLFTGSGSKTIHVEFDFNGGTPTRTDRVHVWNSSQGVVANTDSGAIPEGSVVEGKTLKATYTAGAPAKFTAVETFPAYGLTIPQLSQLATLAKSGGGGGGSDIQTIEVDFDDITGQVEKKLIQYVPAESSPYELAYFANTTTGNPNFNTYTAALNLANYITNNGIYKIKIKNYHFDTTENVWRARYIAIYNKPSDYSTGFDWYTGISFYGFYGLPYRGNIKEKQDEFLVIKEHGGYIILGYSQLVTYSTQLTLFYLPDDPNSSNRQILDSGSIHRYTYMTHTQLVQLYYPDWEKTSSQAGYIHNRPFYEITKTYSIYHDEWEPGAYHPSDTTNPDPDYDTWVQETSSFNLYNALTDSDFADGDTVYMELTYMCNDVEKTSGFGKFTASISQGQEEWENTASLSPASDVPATDPWKAARVIADGMMGTQFYFPVLKTDDGSTIYITKVSLWGADGKYKQLDSNYIKIDNSTLKINANGELYVDTNALRTALGL